jgi:nitrogen regulatory protein PII
MQLLFLVIKRVELVDEIMHALATAGIRGGTCIDSMGMAKSISDMDNLPMIGVLRALLSGEDPDQKGKTIFVAVHEDQVQTARNAIVSVTGDLTQPNAGVLFGVPITFAEGVN